MFQNKTTKNNAFIQRTNISKKYPNICILDLRPCRSLDTGFFFDKLPKFENKLHKSKTFLALKNTVLHGKTRLKCVITSVVNKIYCYYDLIIENRPLDRVALAEIY